MEEAAKKNVSFNWKQFAIWMAALVIGCGLGMIGNSQVNGFCDFIATIYTKLFKFVAVPTIALAVTTTLALLGAKKNTGKIFLHTIIFTLLTTIAAAAVGALLPGGYILKVTAASNNEYFLQFGDTEISDTALTMNTSYNITLSFIDLVDNKGVSQGGMFIVNVKGEDVYSTRIAATDLEKADFEGSTDNTDSQYSTRLWTNGGKQHFSNVKIETNGRLIPEPTTATLSLLALAGLAARRRRR